MELTGNIDMAGQDWTPIGADKDHFFSGTFDGKNHTISNLTLSPTGNYDGLFGYTTGAIQNLKVTGSFKLTETYGANGIAPIAGVADVGSVIINCTTQFEISSDMIVYMAIGGIAGQAIGAKIENCQSDTSIAIGTYQSYVAALQGIPLEQRLSAAPTTGN